jgi:hypothetical protein
MEETAVLNVSLPDGLMLDDSDKALLEAITQAIAGLHHGPGRPLSSVVKLLEADGWEVRCRVGWIAEATNGNLHERAVGSSRGEALRKLLDRTLIDTVEGCP